MNCSINIKYEEYLIFCPHGGVTTSALSLPSSTLSFGTEQMVVCSHQKAGLLRVDLFWMVLFSEVPVVSVLVPHLPWFPFPSPSNLWFILLGLCASSFLQQVSWLV